MDAQHTKHVTYKLAYHFVRCPTYRKKVLRGKLALFVEQEIGQICEARHWTIGTLNIQPDHIHLFLSALPSVAPSEVAHQLKGETAHKVFQSFPEVKKQLWGGARHGLGSSMLGVSEIGVWIQRSDLSSWDKTKTAQESSSSHDRKKQAQQE